MIGTWLTMLGLVIDIAGFALAWSEYEAAVRGADTERRAEAAETQERVAGVDRFSFNQGQTTTVYQDGKKTTTTRQVPIYKKPEDIAREEARIEERHTVGRLERLQRLGDELAARRKQFRLGAKLIVIGFAFQFAGALPIWGA